MYNLRGKTALVTGAGGERGIGRSIAMRLAEEGAHVVVNDYQDQPAGEWGGLSQVVREIEALGCRGLGVVASVDDAAQVDALVAQAVDTFGGIDILVCNAGARAGADRVQVVDLDEADWDRVMNVNAKGTFLCCRAVARTMIQRDRGGKIITIASTAGKVGRARFAAYCSSKFAVRGLTQCLAQELAPHNINVNAICPSLVATERIHHMAGSLAPDDVDAEAYVEVMKKDAIEMSPLGRMAEVTDIANTAAFLASDQSDYLTGLSISVSGGVQMY